MSDRPRAFVRPFSAAEPYEQDEPGQAAFRLALKKDEVPGLQVGLVELKGPIHKLPAAHEEWEQIYLILRGSGTVHLSGQAHRITEPSIVVIPRGAMHSVELLAGEELDYIYVNQYLYPEAIENL